MDRDVQDIRNWNRRAGSNGFGTEEFFRYHPSDKNQIQMIYVKLNPFTGKKQAHFTNYHTATAPDGIPHIHPLYLQKLMTLQSGGDFF